jgi:hypothetical protein
MAEDGIVGAYNGSSAREVPYTPEQWEQLRPGPPARSEPDEPATGIANSRNVGCVVSEHNYLALYHLCRRSADIAPNCHRGRDPRQPDILAGGAWSNFGHPPRPPIALASCGALPPWGGGPGSLCRSLTRAAAPRPPIALASCGNPFATAIMHAEARHSCPAWPRHAHRAVPLPVARHGREVAPGLPGLVHGTPGKRSRGERAAASVLTGKGPAWTSWAEFTLDPFHGCSCSAPRDRIRPRRPLVTAAGGAGRCTLRPRLATLAGLVRGSGAGCPR